MIAARSCNSCERFLWDEKTLQVRRDKITGDPLPRPKHMKTPCSTCPKVPQDVRDNSDPRTVTRADSVELSEQNVAAYLFHQECRATNDFPRGANGMVDPIVRWHARVIEGVEQMFARRESIENITMIASLSFLRGQHGR